MFEVIATFVAPLVGTVDETEGAASPPHGVRGSVPVFRAVAFGTLEKSELLLSVSVHELVRWAACALSSVTVGDVSEQLAVEPYPTKSMIGPEPHAPVMALVPLTRPTLPAVALMLIDPVASAGGSVAPTDPAVPSWTRKYWPAARLNAGRAVTCQVVPAAAAYCTDSPFKFTEEAPRLNSSM
ncbi:MAG TPA: hypothetical protein VGB19_09455 [Actinomycetota bacterium]